MDGMVQTGGEQFLQFHVISLVAWFCDSSAKILSDSDGGKAWQDVSRGSWFWRPNIVASKERTFILHAKLSVES